MTHHAITVLGHDRPGIIAEATRILADLGMNLEDSTMTLLRGHFAMTLVGSGEVEAAAVEEALAPLTAAGDLTVSVREVPEEQVSARVGTSWVLTVHGGDRPGIVSTIVGQVAELGGNITDLTTRLAGELYLLVAEVDLPAGVDVESLRTALRAAGDDLGVGVSLHEVEADDL
ncbi:glycine cleavage system protein R [Nocardioides donggukensis]|uniref:ACT domain-containing protein n=1 Tax=Nocardioides donggukensis TaxID=2774019 RepID=A0A927K4Q0_9ACTN|nr:ACT domain-containing protein [Nocardioides donggukensis]MBD8870459.1 ACT domain-containing protein [Nocardioides donggukensis]